MQIFKTLNPRTYFFTGLLILPAFIFTRNLYFLTAGMLLIVMLNIASGKKVRVLPNIILFAGIVAANLYPPGGKILYTAGVLTVTEEAVLTGIRKAVFLIGTVYISRFAVRKELVIPGKTGELLYKSFYYFEKLTEIGSYRLKSISLNSIIELVDNKMVEISESSHTFLKKEDKSSAVIDSILFISVSFLFWGMFILSKVYLGRG